MKQSNPTANFTFWDFLVDVIPGVVALLIAGSLFPRSYILRQLETVPNLGIVGLFVLVVVGYVVGWVVQAFSRRIDTRLMDYLGHTKLMESYCTKADEAREDDEWCFERRFVEGAQMFFDHNGAEVYDDITDPFDPRTLKNLTQSYVLDNDIGRMYRFKVLHVFMRSLYFLFGLGAVIHFLLVILQLGLSRGYVPALGTLESLGLAIFLTIGCLETYEMRKYLRTSMMRSMMGDFYSAELIK